MRICIIGGGIIGLSIAFELAQQQIETIIVDAGFQAGAASPVAGGMLEPLALSQTALEVGLQSLALYPEFLENLKRLSPLDMGYHTSGILYCEKQFADYENEQSLLNKYGFELQSLTADSLTEAEPALSSQIHAAIYAPQTAQIEPRKLFYALYNACAKSGVLLCAEHAAHFNIQSQKIRAVQTKSHTIFADHFIVAAGAWSGSLLQQLNITAPPVTPVKGQILTVRTCAAIKHIIHDADSFYIVPRYDGRVTIGATVEADAGFDSGIDPDKMNDLLQRACALVPALSDARILNAASGLRPYNGSDQPLIGQSDLASNLLLATGHHRNGILLAPWTAKKIAALLIQKT